MSRWIPVLFDEPPVLAYLTGLDVDDNQPSVLHEERDRSAVAGPFDDAAPVLILGQLANLCRRGAPGGQPQALGWRVQAGPVLHERPMVSVWRPRRYGNARRAHPIGRAGSDKQQGGDYQDPVRVTHPVRTERHGVRLPLGPLAIPWRSRVETHPDDRQQRDHHHLCTSPASSNGIHRIPGSGHGILERRRPVNVGVREVQARL